MISSLVFFVLMSIMVAWLINKNWRKSDLKTETAFHLREESFHDIPFYRLIETIGSIFVIKQKVKFSQSLLWLFASLVTLILFDLVWKF